MRRTFVTLVTFFCAVVLLAACARRPCGPDCCMLTAPAEIKPILSILFIPVPP